MESSHCGKAYNNNKIDPSKQVIGCSTSIKVQQPPQLKLGYQNLWRVQRIKNVVYYYFNVYQYHQAKLAMTLFENNFSLRQINFLPVWLLILLGINKLICIHPSDQPTHNRVPILHVPGLIAIKCAASTNFPILVTGDVEKTKSAIKSTIFHR